MSIAVELPALGESVVEGQVSRWLVKEGDRVERDQPLVEVTTDKVDAEIPAPAAGVVAKILAAEGETVPVGGLLAHIDESASAAAGAVAPAAQPAAAPAPVAAAPAPAEAGTPALLAPANSGDTVATTGEETFIGDIFMSSSELPPSNSNGGKSGGNTARIASIA